MEFLRLIREKYAQIEELEQYTEDAKRGLFSWEHKLLLPYLIKGKRFLIFGSGAGREVFALEREGINAIGVEISPAQIESALGLKKGYNASGIFVNADALLLPFKDLSFDGVLMFRQFIQHFPYKLNRQRLLSETNRVLVPGGLLFLSINTKQFSLSPSRILNYLYKMIIKNRIKKTEDRKDEGKNNRQEDDGLFYKLIINLVGWFVYGARNFYRYFMTFLLRDGYKGPEPGDHLISQVSIKKSKGKIWFHDYSYSEIKKDLQSNGFDILKINDIFEIDSGINFSEIVRRGAKFISIVARKGV